MIKILIKHLSAIFYLLAIAMVVAIAMTGCQKSEHQSDLVVINGAEPESLDPAIVTGIPDGRIVKELFEGLLRYDRKGKIEPGVASSWEISPDHLTYTFHLRSEARWSDGKSVTAHDFIASWRRMLKPETGSANCYQLFVIKGAEEFFEGKERDFSKVGVLALDDQTLQVTLKEPIAYFLDLCAYITFFPVRTDLIQRIGDAWIKPENIICNGPYTLAAWLLNDKITLQKNPFYWDAAHVSLKKIDLLPIEQANVAYNFYATGIADINKTLVPAALLDEMIEKPDFHAAASLGTCFLRFNCFKKPFQDVRVRQAFALCIDQKRIAKKIGRGSVDPAQSFIPRGMNNYVPVKAASYNPVKARRLLAEAGYPQGKNFPLINYLYSENELGEGMAVELQAAWKKELGVTVLLARQEWKVYLSSLKNKDYDIGCSSWFGDYPDPSNFLEIFTSTSGNNRTGWKFPAYDQLLQQASREVDAQQREHLLQQAERILIDEEMPIVPIFFFMGIEMYDPKKLGGIEENILDYHPLRAIWKIGDSR